jgi:tripartite-type tricarboxylate transporter receptor subunit TctC
MSRLMKKSFSSSASVLAIAAMCFVFVQPAAVHAAEVRNYPDRPIRLIDPYAPGGGSGVIARFLSQKMSEAWGKKSWSTTARVRPAPSAPRSQFVPRPTATHCL